MFLHRTNKGRIVYPAAPKPFSRSDVLRVFKGWMTPADQATILEISGLAWEIWLAAGAELTARAIPPFRWIREFIDKALRLLISGKISAADASDVQAFAEETVVLLNELFAVALLTTFVTIEEA